MTILSSTLTILCNVLFIFNMHKLLNQYNLQNLLTVVSPPNTTISAIKQILNNRINSLSSLGYISQLNPNFAQLLNAYIDSYNSLLSNNDPVTTLRTFLNNHSNTVPTLAAAVAECSPQCFPTSTHAFLDSHLADRVLALLLAQNYISIAESNTPLLANPASPISILNSTTAFVATLTELKYAATANTIITTRGPTHEPFIYPPTHIEYIITEILKNAARASLETDAGPINVLLVRNRNSLTIRISDSANGVPPTALPHIWDYAFTTSATRGAVAGMGYGLPLARTYARLLGGDIQLRTVHGQGTHVYIHLNEL